MHALTGTLAAVTLLLYGAMAHADNTSPSQLSDKERVWVEELLPHDMQYFKLHDEPRPFRGTKFLDPRGRKIDLSAFKGEVVVLNFWGTWCAPCRAEMPDFNELHAELGDEGIRVVNISVRESREKAAAYLKRHSFDHLAAYSDARSNLAGEMGINGLPVTAILGTDAREIGRLVGIAKWSSEDAKDWLRTIAKVMSERRVETNARQGAHPQHPLPSAFNRQ